MFQRICFILHVGINIMKDVQYHETKNEFIDFLPPHNSSVHVIQFQHDNIIITANANKHHIILLLQANTNTARNAHVGKACCPVNQLLFFQSITSWYPSQNDQNYHYPGPDRPPTRKHHLLVISSTMVPIPHSPIPKTVAAQGQAEKICFAGSKSSSRYRVTIL